MSFQFLSYKQLRENVAQWRREWVEEFDLNAKTLTTEQKHKKIQMDGLVFFAMQLDALNFSNGKVEKKDKQENVLVEAAISDARKAKMLTAYLISLRQATEVDGEIIAEDQLLHDSIQFLIGESAKNKLDVEAELEAKNALLLIKPLSFAKLCENVNKLRDAEIRKYNKKTGEFNFEKVPLERKLQLTELHDLIDELKAAAIPEQEKAKILMGKMILVREAIRKSYEEGLMARFTSMLGSKPEDSDLYVGIPFAIGITGDKPVDAELIRDAKDALLRFKAKQHAVVTDANKKISAFDVTTLKAPQPRKVSIPAEEQATLAAKELEAIKSTAQVQNRLLATIDQSRVFKNKLEEDSLDFYYRDPELAHCTRQFVNAKTGKAITTRSVIRPALDAQIFSFEKDVKLVSKDITDPYHYVAPALRDNYKTNVKRAKVNGSVETFQRDALKKQPAPVDRHGKLCRVDSEKVEDHFSPVHRTKFDVITEIAGLGDQVQSKLRKFSLLQEAHKTIEKRRNDDQQQEQSLEESQDYTSPSISRKLGA